MPAKIQMHTFIYSTCYWCEGKQKADQTRARQSLLFQQESQPTRSSKQPNPTNQQQATNPIQSNQTGSQLAKQHKQQQQPRAGSVFAATVLFSNTHGGDGRDATKTHHQAKQQQFQYEKFFNIRRRFIVSPFH